MQIKFDANKKKLDTNPVFGLLVQGENLAESIQITGPKMVGALDLSQLRVAVRMTSQQYETTVEKTLDQNTDGDTITFTWQVDKQFTSSPGKVDVMLVGYGGNEEVIKITSSGIVVQEDRTFDTAPPESTWEQILQQMQDFATQAYESKTAAENSAAAAAESQRVTEEKAAQATEAASTAAAQAAAKTEQQIRQYADDRYARPLVTKTGPAASLEVYPDKLSNLKVYAHGFTQQAGTGDPSPTNVRQLTNGGLKLVKLVLTGDETFSASTTVGQKGFYCFVNITNANTGAIQKDAVCSHFKNQIYGFDASTADNNVGNFFVGQASTPRFVFSHEQLGTTPSTSVDNCKAAVKAYCAKEYASGTPVTVWYAANDGTGSLYAPIILQGGEYRATCLPLTAPLCEWDSVVSWVKSGCDVELVLNGTESWRVHSTRAFYADTSKQQTALIPFSNFYTGVATATEMKNYAKSVQIGSAGIYIWDTDYNGDVEAFKTHLQEKYASGDPVKIWIKSSADVPLEGSIPLSLETHVQAVLVLDGTENLSDVNAFSSVTRFKVAGVANVEEGAQSVCSHFKNNLSWTSNTPHFYMAPNSAYIFVPNELLETKDADGGKKWLAAQYAAGTPVTIVYQLTTPITYAHPDVVLPALTDNTGKVTITGQNGGTVTVVFNKSIVKAFEELQSAVLAAVANLSI